ncbi:MAG: nitrous oxide reductase family maturation protein NosD [Phycisphaeraceae bacterium]|nr:MAG: nitrous oxide reductase family maturation protein NosD [Phycisphaeraceae bacterium]
MNQRATIAGLALAAAVSGAWGGPEDHAPPAVAPVLRDTFEVGAIGQRIESASEGDVIRLEPGVYRERVRIGKRVTIDGGGRAVIDGGGTGDIVEITAAGAVLRGVTIRNTGTDLDRENAGLRVLAGGVTVEGVVLEDVLFGIDLREAPGCVVRGCRIGGKALDIARRGDGLRLWRSDGALIEGTTIHDGRDAILWYSKGVVIRGNRSDDCRYGFHLMFSDDVLIEGNTLTGNSVGAYLMYSTGVVIRGNRFIRNRGPSGYGIGLKETDRFEVTDNLIVGNRSGVYIDGSPFTGAAPGVFTRNTIAYNDVGVTFLPSAKGNEMTLNNFIGNIEQVSVSGRGGLTANRFWVGEVGNFWSDYTGYDRDGDGVGDFVHESSTFFENLMDRHPRLRLFMFSPAQQAVEFVARAVPAVRPEPKFEDEVPRMRPVAIGLVERAEGSSAWRMAGVSGLMLAGGVLVLAWSMGGAGRPRGGEA